MDFKFDFFLSTAMPTVTQLVTDTMLVCLFSPDFCVFSSEFFRSDFINGWDKGVLQKAVDNCHCNPYGDVSYLSRRPYSYYVDKCHYENSLLAALTKASST